MQTELFKNRQRSRWTGEEEKALISGGTVDSIALALGRTADSIKTRASMLKARGVYVPDFQTNSTLLKGNFNPAQELDIKPAVEAKLTSMDISDPKRVRFSVGGVRVIIEVD